MIVYLERLEIVPEGQEADFARIFYDPATEGADKASLVALIPNGITQKHTCLHKEGGSCKMEVL